MSDKEIEDAGGPTMIKGDTTNTTFEITQKITEQLWPDESNRTAKPNDAASAGDANIPDEGKRKSLFFHLRAYNSDSSGGQTALRPSWYSEKGAGSKEADGNASGLNPSPYLSQGQTTLQNMPLAHLKNGLPYYPKGGDFNENYNLYFRHQEVSNRPSMTNFSTGTWSQAGKEKVQAYWDMGTSRVIFNRDGTKNDFFDATGTISSYNRGAADALVQTPLWTLNYPEYKCPLLGQEQYISREEINSVSTDYTIKVDSSGGSGKFKGRWINHPYNYSRNFATWWGINQ